MKDFEGRYFKAPNDIFEIGLNPFQITVYLYLARCGNNSEAAFPSLRTIQKKCGMSRPTVTKVLDDLEQLGLLRKERRRVGTKNQSNRYTVTVPNVELSGKNDLPPMVNEINHGGKGDLPYKELPYKEPTYKDKRYIDFDEIDAASYLQIYHSYYKRKFNKQHPRVTEEQAQRIIAYIDQLNEWDVDEETFEEAVAEHFDKLPISNDGKIFPFIEAAHRYFIGERD